MKPHNISEQSNLAMLLYKLQFDPYRQCEMFGADGVVWNLTACMIDGTTERIDVTYNPHDTGSLENPFVYQLHQITTNGYKRIDWASVAEVTQ